MKEAEILANVAEILVNVAASLAVEGLAASEKAIKITELFLIGRINSNQAITMIKNIYRKEGDRK